MKNITIRLFISLCLIVGGAASVSAATLSAPGGTGETEVQFDITVDTSLDVAGAAFTLSYDTTVMDVTVESTFFDTWQQQNLPPGGPYENVDGYSQPLVTNGFDTNINGVASGLRIAAARKDGADGTNNVLFKVTCKIKFGVDAGTYPISIVPTSLCNPDAGYGADPNGSLPTLDGDETFETIPLLVGTDETETDLNLAFWNIIPADGEPMPGPTEVFASGDVTFNQQNLFNLDVDGNGTARPMTDGFLIMRYLFGYEDDPANGTYDLTKDKLAEAVRTAAEIGAFLESGYSSDIMDIDGNNEQDPMTDGFLIMRYLFGYEDDPANGTYDLTKDKIGTGATRTAAEIATYLGSLMP